MSPSLPDTVARQVQAAQVLRRAGLLRSHRPDRLIAAALELANWGLSLPGGYAAAAALRPDAAAIIDEAGELSFAAVDDRTDALAAGLAASGIADGDNVGILCRNHHWMVEATIALSKLGARSIFLNTGFAAPQLEGVARAEKISAIIHDREFAAVVRRAVPADHRHVAWTDTAGGGPRSLQRLIERHEGAEVTPVERPGGITILTSGTTGTPKGAARDPMRSIDPAVAILSRIPLRTEGRTLVASPLFHAWGLAHLGLATALSSTLVLRRRFDAEATLAAIAAHRVTALVAVPVMLRQILDLPREVRRRHDITSLEVVAVSGSALPGELATRFMDEFGDILYNLYGSTEVAWATIATPEDMRAAPGTAGRPPLGTVVRIRAEDGSEVAPGASGRIFVGNEMLFSGYTGGGGKDVVDGTMATGDVGRFDDEGRLFVEGRDDEMLVSGGENVFPVEIEEALVSHRDITDAAVIGVADERWGQSVHAVVVRRRGSRLTADGVRAHVRRQLASYKVPKEVRFVDALPRNAAGKVLKRELDPSS